MNRAFKRSSSFQGCCFGVAFPATLPKSICAFKEYLADGLTEETISKLGRLNPERLGVIARTSVMGYKHKDERMQAKLLKHSTLKIYPGFPHGMMTTHADAINADILAFIEGATVKAA